jgi:hypothetical protein
VKVDPGLENGLPSAYVRRRKNQNKSGPGGAQTSRGLAPKADQVQGVWLSSVELGTNFGTKFRTVYVGLLRFHAKAGDGCSPARASLPGSGHRSASQHQVDHCPSYFIGLPPLTSRKAGQSSGGSSSTHRCDETTGDPDGRFFNTKSSLRDHFDRRLQALKEPRPTEPALVSKRSATTRRWSGAQARPIADQQRDLEADRRPEDAGGRTRKELGQPSSREAAKAAA